MNDERRKRIEQLIKNADLLGSVQELVDEFNNRTDTAWEEFQHKLELLQGDAADLASSIEEVKGEEEEYLENMPEGLKAGDKGSQAEDAISALQEAIDRLEGVTDFDPDKPVLEDCDVDNEEITASLETALG